MLQWPGLMKQTWLLPIPALAVVSGQQIIVQYQTRPEELKDPVWPFFGDRTWGQANRVSDFPNLSCSPQISVRD